MRAIGQHLRFAVDMHDWQELRLQRAGRIGGVAIDHPTFFGKVRKFFNYDVTFARPAIAMKFAVDQQNFAIRRGFSRVIEEPHGNPCFVQRAPPFDKREKEGTPVTGAEPVAAK